MCRLAIFLAVVLSFAPRGAIVFGQTNEQFLKEAQGGWARIEQYLGTLKGRVVVKQRPIIGNAQALDQVHEFMTSNGNQRYHVIHKERGGLQTLDVVNNAYAFRASRDSENEEWAVSFLGPTSRIDSRLGQRNQPLRVPLTLDLQPLPWTVNGSGFRLLSVAPSQLAPEFVDLTFESSDRYRRQYHLASGTVTLDPGHDWAVREYEVRVEYTDDVAVTRGRIEYVEDNRRFLTPKKATMYTKSQSGIEVETTFEYELFVPERSPREAFTLSSIGLPEPLEYEISSRFGNLWIWIAIVGAVSVVIGYFLIKRHSS